jgi:hypothetical protein
MTKKTGYLGLKTRYKQHYSKTYMTAANLP